MIDYLSLKRITDLHAAEITAAVNRVVGSGWYLQGQETQQFEAEYAQYIGTKHCITCGNKGLEYLLLCPIHIGHNIQLVRQSPPFAG